MHIISDADALLWHGARDGLVAMPSIDAKMCIERNHNGVVMHFGHANEAGIGEAHRNVSIFSHKPEHFIEVLADEECADNGPTFEQGDEL
jgi:hypothetical protein